MPRLPSLNCSVPIYAFLVVSGCGIENEIQVPSVDFQIHETNPVLPPGPPEAWDGGLVDPGAMMFYAGQFHMLYNGIPSWPHRLAVGYATSTDGVTWVRQSPDPIFDHRNVPFAGWGIRANSVVVEDGTWILYFAIGDEEAALRGRIGRAVSPSPEGVWSVDTVPVLRGGPPGAWDATAVGDAKVVPDAHGYTMYFTGLDENRVGRIGRATSTDGVLWNKYDDPETSASAVRVSDPVLEAGGPGSWDSRGVTDPSVVRTADGGWLMVYRASDDDRSALGVAFSSDGITWRKSSQPIVSNTSSPNWDTIHFNAVLSIQQRWFVYFEAAVDGGGTAVQLISHTAQSQ